jgi:rSAM/selenodomain-associated transferase 2
MTTKPPELSIIVPVLNDAIELKGLLTNLNRQEGVTFEVILCDGGSSDDIPSLVSGWTAGDRFKLLLITSARGRGIQMNSGAAAAASDTLLFLHADSRFPDKNSLKDAVHACNNQRMTATTPWAARFKLQFRRSLATPSLAYYYHEAKARLNHGSCIRGDQGFLIDRKLFEQLGSFDCSLPFLEDVRLAAQLAGRGEWLLLPALISTSARRFEQEGFFERQVANVVIVNAMVTGWNELLIALPGLYRCNNASGRLSLFPLLDGVHGMIARSDRAWRKTFWKATGVHVAGNAWQIFFWLDVHRAFRSGRTVEEIEPYWLAAYERSLKSLFESGVAARLAELLTRVWLWWMRYRTRTGSPL